MSFSLKSSLFISTVLFNVASYMNNVGGAGKKRGCLFDFHRETACQSVAIKKGGQFTILTIHFYCCNGITEALRND